MSLGYKLLVLRLYEDLNLTYLEVLCKILSWLARIIHESPAPSVDMTVLPGVLGP